MIIAAKRLSQVATHMGIAYVVAYALTGSAIFSGLAVLVEPLINVLLLPLHQAAWVKLRRGAWWARGACLGAACEKLSQTGLHAGVAFGVMYVATGSVAIGGIAALLEPVCNVLVLPFHDRLWEGVERGMQSKGGQLIAM
ncbi:DUF2061 domain-containing protein [Massilia jejuensis]|uniref:DUF2061 domain-containing protein n=1 Tax=Massilia jejuensis TaxID=648894 RepID=A0ABW0PLQ1_9BURK